jgi:U3 small nucleolar RNA-associated protein 15
MTASDDKTINLYDIPSQSRIASFTGHDDYIRAGFASLSDANLFATGSYDHTVKLWDKRVQNSVMSYNHKAPVESVLMFPNNNMVLSAGSNYFGVHDLMSGGNQQFQVNNHQKVITSLCFNNDYTRVLSGSLDQHVKIYDVEEYSVVHSIKYPSPILSLAMTPDDAFIVTGMTNGYLSLREREIKTGPEQVETTVPNPGTKKFYARGAQHKPEEEDLIVSVKKHAGLKAYDKFLRKFQYKNALDAALEVRKQGKVYLDSRCDNCCKLN